MSIDLEAIRARRYSWVSAQASADLHSCIEEVERLRIDKGLLGNEIDDARMEVKRLRAENDEIRAAAEELIAAGDKMRESNVLLRDAVEHDETVYMEIARAAGFDHEPPSDERVCVEAVKAMRVERDELRAIIAGRETAPTDAEIEAHWRTGGGWTFQGWCLTRSAGQARSWRDQHSGFTTLVWRPLDAGGAPCAWPKESP